MIPEVALYEFLKETIEAADSASQLYEIALHDTLFQPLTEDVAIRIGEVESSIAPLPGAEEAEEFDARFPLVIYSRIPKDEWDSRVNYRDQVNRISRELALLIYNDPRLNLRVNDCRVLGSRRGYDSINTDRFAVANLDVIINETGQQIGG